MGDHIEVGGAEIIEGHVGSRKNLIGHHLNMSYNENLGHSPVNRKKYRGCSWESRKDNQQVEKDKEKKGCSWAGMCTPHPRTDMGGEMIGVQHARPRIGVGTKTGFPRAHIPKTVKKDQKVHLYGRPMITRISL
jgi:hypothetical protein